MHEKLQIVPLRGPGVRSPLHMSHLERAIMRSAIRAREIRRYTVGPPRWIGSSMTEVSPMTMIDCGTGTEVILTGTTADGVATLVTPFSGLSTHRNEQLAVYGLP